MWVRDLFQSLKKIRKNLTSLMGFEFLYRTAVFLFFFRASAGLFQALLGRIGYSYLTAENYSVFMSSPLTVFIIIVLAAGILLLLFFELCVIVRSGILEYEGKPPGLSDVFLGGMKVFYIQLKRNGGFVFLFSGMMGIFACTHLMIQEILDIKILKYTLEKLYNVGDERHYLVWVLAVVLIISMFSMYSIPVLINEDKKGIYVFRRSLAIFQAQPGRSVGILLLGNLAVTAGMLFLYYLLLFVAAVLAAVFLDAQYGMTVLFSLSSTLHGLMGFVSGIIGIVTNMLLITLLYMRFLEEERCEERQEKSGLQENPWAKDLPGKKRLAILFLIICTECVYLYSTWTNGTLLTGELYEQIFVTAHRGGAGNAPENTLAALELAMEHMSDYAEVDVQETSDGVLVLMHDSNLKRTCGVNRKIWEVTYEEIRTLDAGSYFSAEYKGEPVPTLEEILDVCNGRLDLNIEVKRTPYNEGIAGKTATLITERNMESQCLITSMNYEYLKEVKEVNPAIRTGYIASVAYGNVESLEYADFLSVKHDCVDETFVEQVHAAGKELHVWTVNTRRLMRRMKLLGVDNIITDRPGIAREILMEDADSYGFLERLRFVLE